MPYSIVKGSSLNNVQVLHIFSNMSVEYCELVSFWSNYVKKYHAILMTFTETLFGSTFFSIHVLLFKQISNQSIISFHNCGAQKIELYKVPTKVKSNQVLTITLNQHK